MMTPLAWRNVAHSKLRSLIALGGISFAILLIFMQLGFYAAARSSATQLYETLDFDVILLSTQYVFTARPAQLPRNRLEQVRAIEGVKSVAPIWIGAGKWRNPETGKQWITLMLGVEPALPSFRDEAVNRQLPLLTVADNVLGDLLSRPENGPIVAGVDSEFERHRVRVVGQCIIGAGFSGGATLVAGRDTFLRIFPQAAADRISAGLVKLHPGISAESAAVEMRKQLWPRATAVTRRELFDSEQAFWLHVKPIGIMFTSGVVVAFFAGAVILYQVLASEVQNRLREYATLKALGYGSGFVYGIVLRQALIFSLLGFIPAFFMAFFLYFLLRSQALIPIGMEFTRASGVLLLTIAMCLSATLLAVRKLREADPADLF